MGSRHSPYWCSTSRLGRPSVAGTHRQRLAGIALPPVVAGGAPHAQHDEVEERVRRLDSTSGPALPWREETPPPSWPAAGSAAAPPTSGVGRNYPEHPRSRISKTELRVSRPWGQEASMRRVRSATL